MKQLNRLPPSTQPAASSPQAAVHPKPSFGVLAQRSLVLMKPVTWFAASWAFLCGAVASGMLTWSVEGMTRLVLGLVMAGPILCGLSQIVNDYCDSEVDAINQPERLIPSGLVTLRHVQVLSLILLAIGSLLAVYLGRTVALLVGVGLFFAVAYSMEPMRGKRNGWVGNALVSFSYEGLAWLAGVAAFAVLDWRNVAVATLYSIGAHGIMTVNDFKSMEGDRQMGIRSIPVMYGPQRAAWLVVLTMAVTQLVIIALLVMWGQTIAALVVGLLVVAQLFPYVRFLRAPERNAVFFNATAIMLFVWGMLATAIGVAGAG